MTGGRARTRAAARAGGFTLIEILVVMSILAVLAVLLLPNVVGATVEGQIAETKARVMFLVNAANAYEREHRYPPDDFKAVDGKSMGKDNGINSGIESLVLFLCQKRLGRDSLADHEGWLANTDTDENTAEIPLLERKALMEVVDAWGVPLFYASAATGGYNRAQTLQMPEGETVKVRAHKNPQTGRVAGRNKFQVISAGPDGLFATEDDIVHPETR